MAVSLRVAMLAVLLSNVALLFGIFGPAVLNLPHRLSATAPRLGMALSLLYVLIAETLFRTKTAAATVPSAEDRKTSALCVSASALMQLLPFCTYTLLPALRWGHVNALHESPFVVVPLALAVAAAGVLRFSAMAALADNFSRTLTVRKGQHVIRGGPYGYCRHPGYAANGVVAVTCALLVSANVVVAAVCAVVFCIVWNRRIVAEEAMLRQGLNGYAEYMTAVRWRLVPWVY
jgi:protein-S-isoprenylcysteine O-methyltransferase Ste14